MDAVSGMSHEKQKRSSLPEVPTESRGDYVLVIDDDPAVVDLLVTFLREDEGLSVHASHSIKELLQQVPTEPPALILLDITMPQESYGELAPALRRLPGWYDIPIVLCSGQDSLPDIAREVGAAGYIAKPFSLDDIADLAHRYVAGSSTSPEP